jgi:hypothetical protein
MIDQRILDVEEEEKRLNQPFFIQYIFAERRNCSTVYASFVQYFRIAYRRYGRFTDAPTHPFAPRKPPMIDSKDDIRL